MRAPRMLRAFRPAEIPAQPTDAIAESAEAVGGSENAAGESISWRVNSGLAGYQRVTVGFYVLDTHGLDAA
jgi:hypothetical protein